MSAHEKAGAAKRLRLFNRPVQAGCQTRRASSPVHLSVLGS
jgi:hypothetical protein